MSNCLIVVAVVADAVADKWPAGGAVNVSPDLPRLGFVFCACAGGERERASANRKRERERGEHKLKHLIINRRCALHSFAVSCVFSIFIK